MMFERSLTAELIASMKTKLCMTSNLKTFRIQPLCYGFLWYLYTISKNDVISSGRKHYCALGLGCEGFMFQISGSQFNKMLYSFLIVPHNCKVLWLKITIIYLQKQK